MAKPDTPRSDALRAMREAAYEAAQEKQRAEQKPKRKPVKEKPATPETKAS